MSPPERAEKCKANARWKLTTMIRVKLLSNVIQMAVDISIVSTMGIANIAWKSATSPWLVARAIRTMSAKKECTTGRRCISSARPSTRPNYVVSCLKEGRT
eukprot:3192506-Ditylum_brightwellii.AAC.1